VPTAQLDVPQIGHFLSRFVQRALIHSRAAYPEPDWRELGVVVRVTIPTHPFFAEDGDGDGEGSDEGDRLVEGRSMSVEQRAAWVLAEIDAGRPVTNQYLARTLGVSLATVERLTRRMQQEDTIRWSGTRRSGSFQRT
jgi:CRP-like cAMP-binding protein